MSGVFMSVKTAIAKAIAALSASLAASAGAGLVGFKQSGVGAVQRTVQDELRDRVSVKQFGAVGDGIADDTAAINLAIKKVGSGSLHFPAGTYKVTAPLNGGAYINSLRITGDSRDSSIIKYFGASGTMLELNVGTVEDIQIMSNGSKSDGLALSGLKISGPSKVSRCTVSGFSNAGIIIASQYASVIESCKIANNTYGVLGDGTAWSGISVTSLTIQFNQFLSNTYGFYNDSNADVWRLVIENNLFDYSGTGITIATHNATVSNNWIEHSSVAGGVITNTYITLLGNRCVGALDNIIVQNSGLSADARGYLDIALTHEIAARKFKLINGVGLNDTGADSVDLFNTGTELKLLNAAYPSGKEPRLMTSPAQFKTSVVRYNYGYAGGASYVDNNTGFTLTRHSAGKYLVSFNRAIQNFNWFVSGHLDTNVTTDGSVYDTSWVCEATAVAVNASTGNWRSYSQATGMVVILRNNTGALVDGQFSLQIIEPLANIFAY